jgi:hypothetical protein
MARYRRGWSRGWKKSPRGSAGEWFDSGWELQYMREMELDPLVVRWTRHHDLRIPYRKWWGARGFYEPDFIVELAGGGKELREVKGGHLFADKNTAKKLAAGERYCRERGMRYKVITKQGVNPEIWSLPENVVVDEIEHAPSQQIPATGAQPPPAGLLSRLAALLAGKPAPR